MNLVNIDNSVTMTSSEIAQLVGSRHDKVKQSIERLVARGVISLPPVGEVKIQRARRVEVSDAYIFSGEKGKRDSIVVVAQLSPEFTAKLVDRWQELERKLQVNAQTKIDRQYARLETPELTNALKSQREAKGKEIAPHIFSNDYNMMNRIVLGLTSAHFRKEHEIGKAEAIRDYLSPVQTEAMLKIQRINTSLIEIGMEYKDRKEKLQQYFNDNFKDKMIEEVLRLES